MLRPKRVKTPLSLSEVSSILILRYDALGDAVLTTPVWRSIKKYAPHIKIGVAGSARNRALLEADPDIDEVFILSRGLSMRTLRELRRAKQTKWDIVLNLFFHDKTRAAIFSKIVAPSGISVTIVREKKEKYLRLYSTIGDRPAIPTPMVLQNLKVLEEAVDISITEMDTFPSLLLNANVQKFFQYELHILLAGLESYIIINTDASQTYKEWGFENSLALSKLLMSNTKYQVFWTSAPQRATATKHYLDEHPPHDVKYLDTPSILHLAAAVRGAAAVVSPDTSVIHFATAQQTPVVGLYLEENEFLPYGSISRVLFAPDRMRASLISVEDVYNALTGMLAPR